MGEAVFFTIPGDAEFQVRIGQLGCAANCALVQRLGLISPAVFKALPSGGDFLSMFGFTKEIAPEEDKIIGQCREQCTPQLHRDEQELQKEYHSIARSDPFDLERQEVGKIYNRLRKR